MKRTVERWGVWWVDSSPRCCSQRRGALLDPGSRKQDTRNSWDCHSMCKANETTALDSVVSSQSFLADNSRDKTSSCCGLSQVVCHSGKSGSSIFISFHWSQKLFSLRLALLIIHSCTGVPPCVLGLNSVQLSLRGSVHFQPKHTLWSPLFMSENPPGSRYSACVQPALFSQWARKRHAQMSGAWEEKSRKKGKQTGRWHLVHLSVTINNA